MARLSTLQVALAASVLFHAALLMVHFGLADRIDDALGSTPLEIILVNARSHEQPDQAQALAQASLAGGGEQAEGLAGSPLPASELAEVGDSIEDKHKRIEEMEQEQDQLLAQVQSELEALEKRQARHEGGVTQQNDDDERRRQLIKQRGEIQERIVDENKRPKKRYVSPETKEAAYAIYCDAMRLKIQDRGSRDYPESHGTKLAGKLVMNITVDAKGNVVEADVKRTSGNPLLDRRAVAIVEASGPYGPFTEAMRKASGLLVYSVQFEFTPGQGLQTKFSDSIR